MANIKFGCEVYTWFMKETGKAYDNKLDHMIEVAAKAGFVGIEPMHFWMGDLRDPARLRECLNKHSVQLAGIALVLDWNGPEETAEERLAADETIELCKQFPGALLCTVQMPTGRHDLEQRQKNLVANVNAVSRRAKEQGLNCSFHPNSPDESIIRTQADYDAVLPKLDTDATGWTPDVGHIAVGGMDPLATMKQYSSLINHVHYKDWYAGHDFAQSGEGNIDFPGITKWLVDQNYDGWIIVEDEAPAAEKDPDTVTMKDGVYVREKLKPLVM